MTTQASDDDDQLLHRLAQALATAEPLTARIRQLGDGAYAWHGVDAELESASLVYDSLVQVETGVRGEPDVRRTVQFEASAGSVELERTGDVVVGQVIPPVPGTASLVGAAGEVADAEVDELGCFSFDRVPPGPVRLRWCTPAGGVVSTWLML